MMTTFMLRLQAFGDLCRRYGSVFGSCWAIRKQLDAPPRLREELQFLPANLELIETPVHPAPRWTLRLIMLLTLIVLVIAVFGKLDIIATAKGKLIPSARVKVIQPAITGVVREILVHDGQRVTAGQRLLVLDTTQAAADADKARSSRIDAELAQARARALLEAQRTNVLPALVAVDAVPPEKVADSTRFTDGIFREYSDKLSGARAELSKRRAELAGTLQEIAKLRATAPLARKEADDYKALSVGSYVAQHDYLDKEKTALEQEHELAAQQSHAQELEAGIVEQQSTIESTVSQFRREQLEALDKATQQFSQNRDDETKANTRQQLLSLTSPVAGTIQQLSVHTLGGVVTTAQSLMEVVPDDAVEVEVSVENKDIGFVDVGQDAMVKIEAFPYTRYGYLVGKVVSVSNDAVQDKNRKLGLTFVARIRLPTSRMRIEQKWIDLTPGMEVTADIKTGRRSVAGYFLDPMMRNARESLHER